jgi:hypothetical protein
MKYLLIIYHCWGHVCTPQLYVPDMTRESCIVDGKFRVANSYTSNEGNGSFTNFACLVHEEKTDWLFRK